MPELTINRLEKQTAFLPFRDILTFLKPQIVLKEGLLGYYSQISSGSAFEKAAGTNQGSCSCPRCVSPDFQAQKGKEKKPLWPDYTESYWTSKGKTGRGERYYNDGDVIYDLGNLKPGVKRIEYRNGYKLLVGLEVNGRPVKVIKHDFEEFWAYKVRSRASQLLKDSFSDKIHAEGVFNFDNGKANIRYVQFKTGDNGAQRSYIYLLDGSKKTIVSQRFLTKAQLQNLAQAIYSAPPKALEKREFIFVVNEIGYVKAHIRGKDYHTIKGIFNPGVPNGIFVRSDLLKTYKDIARRLWHEASHGVDFDHGWLSSKIKDLKGKLLFGSKEQGRKGWKFSFVSRRATTGGYKEDFAESSRVVGELWAQYKKDGKGDLLKQSRDEIENFFKKHYKYPLVQEKLMAVVIHVYHPEWLRKG